MAERHAHLPEHTQVGDHVHTAGHMHDGDHACTEGHTHSVDHAHTVGHTHGGDHAYTEGHTEGHTHVHSAGYEKAIVNRISRSIGHLESIKRMVENGKDCSEVLIQLAAVKAAVNNTGKVILKEHLAHCIVDAIEHGDTESVEKLNKAIDIFIK